MYLIITLNFVCLLGNSGNGSAGECVNVVLLIACTLMFSLSVNRSDSWYSVDIAPDCTTDDYQQLTTSASLNNDMILVY